MCAAWVVACSGGAPVVPDALVPSAEADGLPPAEAPTERSPYQGLPIVVEAWPTGDDAGASVDALLDGAIGAHPYRPASSAPTPWSIVFALDPAPREVAAIGLVVDSPHEPAVESVTVFGYLGNVPLTRANYGQMIEGSVRLGVAQVDASGELVVLELESPRLLHYVWIRVAGARGDTHVGLHEVIAYAPSQLRALRELRGVRAQFASLAAVDTTPYQGQTVTGLPALDASAPDPAEQIERFAPPMIPQNDDDD